MKVFTAEDLPTLEDHYRKNLINSVSGHKSVNLVGTIDEQKRTNLSIVSSAVHLGANPALLGFIMRPHSVDRHTLENILEVKDYTFNHVHSQMFRSAHQTSARYPKEVSEFKATGLTEKYSNRLMSPYVAESRIRIGLKLVEVIPIKINRTELVIGEIQEIFIEGDYLNSEGCLNLALADSISVSGLDSYYQSTLLGRLSYAKPDKELLDLAFFQHPVK